MNSAIEHILLQDHLSSADLKHIEDACAADASLSSLVRNWAALKNSVRRSLTAAIPESQLLVLYALRQHDSESLTVEEGALLRASENQIEAALSNYPSVEVILGRIKKDATAFDSVWTECTSAESTVVRSAISTAAAKMSPTGNAASTASAGLLQRLGRSMALRPAWYALAASFTLLMASLIIFQQVGDVSSGVTIGTPDGKVNVVTLPDGSTARLSAGSSITLPVGDTFDRYLTLSGSAFFDVVPGEIQFRIETVNANVVIYGTSFGVTSEASTGITEVTLVTGSLSLSSINNGTAVMLKPGEFSRVVGGSAPSEPQVVDLENALSWSDLFVFEDTPLSDVSERLSARYGVSISVDENLLSRTVTGTFAPENGLPFILDAVAAAVNVRIEADEAQTTFRITS